MCCVLVVGESPASAQALAFRLGVSGFEAAASAADVPLALRSVFVWKPNAIVLDGCSGDEGRELFRLLENVSRLPILVLGNGENEGDLIWYLEQGAADYLVKPVSITLLTARLRAVLRRTVQETQSGVIRLGDLEIDLDRHEVRRRHQRVSLTPTEFRLLRALAERPGQACTQQTLLKQVWGQDFANCAHYLRLYVGYLRQKLEDEPKRPRLLVTEWGVGYRLLAGRRGEGLPALRPTRMAVA